MRAAHLFLLTALAQTVIQPIPARAAEDGIAGEYAMAGTSLRPNSRGYEGVCILTANGKVYDVNCTNTGSGDKYTGRGILRGGQFSLYLGEYLAVYTVESDGRLVGNWTHSRSDDYGEETLTPKSPAKM